MFKYKNLSGKSNVEAFKIGDKSIIVKFKSGRERYYLYTYSATGQDAVETMKKLALKGIGLGRMLATKPYHAHERKW